MWLYGSLFFSGLLVLVYLCLPGQRVSKQRLGIDREKMNLGRSIEQRLGADRYRRLAQALNLAGITTDPGTFVLRVVVVSVFLAIVGLFLGLVWSLLFLVVPIVGVRSWVAYKGRKRQEAF